MVRQSWFDEKTNLLLFNQYVSQMESWQKALADGIIEALTQIFYEWAVLQAMVGYLELSEVDEEE